MTLFHSLTPRTMTRLFGAFALSATLLGGAPAEASAQSPAADSSAQADGHHHRRGRHHRRGHRGPMAILRQLDLSDAQQEQVREIMRSSRAERQAIRALEGEERRSRAHAHRSAVRARIDAVLTPEQRAQAARLRTEQRARRIERKVTRMTERLNLTPAQASQIRAILERNAPTPGTRPNRDARRAVRAEINTVLTEEQRALRRAHRAEHGRRGRGHMRGHRRGGMRGHGGASAPDVAP